MKIKAAKKLKIFNGRGHGKHDRKSIYVAAYSKKHAAELVNKACESHIRPSEIANYYAPCWGNPMKGIEPVEPCVYVGEPFGSSTPVRIL